MTKLTVPSNAGPQIPVKCCHGNDPQRPEVFTTLSKKRCTAAVYFITQNVLEFIFQFNFKASDFYLVTSHRTSPRLSIFYQCFFFHAHEWCMYGTLVTEHTLISDTLFIITIITSSTNTCRYYSRVCCNDSDLVSRCHIRHKHTLTAL